jgi:hypothetical protein
MKNTTKLEGEKPLAELAKIPTVSKVALRGLDRLLREAEGKRLKAEIDGLEKERDKIDWRGCSCKWRGYLDQSSIIETKKSTLRELTGGEEKYTKIRSGGMMSLSSEIERLSKLQSWSNEDRSEAALLMAIGVRRLEPKRDYSDGPYSMH